MYIEYVTYNDFKVLHQLREVEEGATAKQTMKNAVKRLEATGFERTGSGNFAWTERKTGTDAYVHFGSLEGARANIIRAFHEYSFLD